MFLIEEIWCVNVFFTSMLGEELHFIQKTSKHRKES
jgi:hypothetical protein